MRRVQINGQLTPAARFVGVGGGITDFAAYMQNDPSGFGAAWGQVQQQLTAEGTSPGDVSTAKAAFANAYSTLTSNFAQDSATALQGATGYTISGGTIAGAIQNVEGLVSAVESGVPAQIVASFAGTLIGISGLLVAGAVIAPGIGAAIVIGVELVEAVCGALFASTPPAATVGTCSLAYVPLWVVQDVFPIPNPHLVKVTAGPKSPQWRRFPVDGSAADAWWFTPATGVGGVALNIAQWTSGTSTDMWSACGNVGDRPIDLAFSRYHQLECEQQDNAALVSQAGAPAEEVVLAQFYQAFFAAWKCNKEFELNGLASQDDGAVLVHTAYLWNKAHAPGNGFVITAPSPTSSPSDVISLGTSCSSWRGGAHQTLAAMLINGLSGTASSSLQAAGFSPNGGLPINTGPRLKPPIVTALPGSATASSSKLATAATVGAVVVGGALTTAAVYSYVTQQALGAVLSKAWDRVTGKR